MRLLLEGRGCALSTRFVHLERTWSCDEQLEQAAGHAFAWWPAAWQLAQRRPFSPGSERGRARLPDAEWAPPRRASGDAGGAESPARDLAGAGAQCGRAARARGDGGVGGSVSPGAAGTLFPASTSVTARDGGRPGGPLVCAMALGGPMSEARVTDLGPAGDMAMRRHALAQKRLACRRATCMAQATCRP